jgi:hypothetical protein
MKPANPKARSLLAKLQALAEQGIDGERMVARKKLARLRARFDFSAPDTTDTPDLFAGKFKQGSAALHIHTFKAADFDIANSVKWAIEAATKIPCVYRNGNLLAQATPGTAKKLAEIATHITGSFRSLVDQFGAVDGVKLEDRAVFVMGLYDGMMNETREVGQRLPSRGPVKKVGRTKKGAPTSPPVLNVHPYAIGHGLGRQVRFSVPLEQISAELENAIKGQLPQSVK